MRQGWYLLPCPIRELRPSTPANQPKTVLSTYSSSRDGFGPCHGDALLLETALVRGHTHRFIVGKFQANASSTLSFGYQ